MRFRFYLDGFRTILLKLEHVQNFLTRILD
jgi:hypothetical protein